MAKKRLARLRGTKPQTEFCNTQEQYPLFVAGFGSGKTEALFLRALKLKMAMPHIDHGYYLPTYDLVNRIGFPRIESKLSALGIPYKINKNEKVVYIGDRGNLGLFIFRTMDSPERIIGYEHGDASLDELDTLPKDKAEDVWNKVIGRNRQKKPGNLLNTIAVGTTPEGFRFAYARWAKNEKEAIKNGYVMIRASTMSNARNLPPGYIESLRNSYPPNLLEAYLNGQFVNLTQGSVYPNFCREKNGTNVTPWDGEPIHIGMDFNVRNMSAVAHVIRDGVPYAVKEFIKIDDTPTMIETLKAFYADEYGAPRHHITVYPDSSGDNSSTINASISDIKLLRDAGFSIRVPASNPRIRDRVVSFNGLILNSNLERRYFVNEEFCPEFVDCLEQQPYDDKGKPDKSGGLDHLPDAAGYFVWQRYGLQRPILVQEPF